eukprot:TCONS_00000971-protein
MFGSGKKGKSRASKSPNDDMSNVMGLGGMDSDDEDESSLLAELAALEGRPVAPKKAKPKKALVSMDEIDREAEAGMADIHDGEINNEDDFDENDLLAELNDIVSDEEDKPPPPKVEKPAAASSGGMQKTLTDRREIYVQAIANAKAEGASSKVRRFDRGLKEIERLIKSVSKGATISEDDIPPPVVVKSSSPINPKTQTLPPPEKPGRATVITPVEPFTAPVETPPTRTPEPQPVTAPTPQPRPTATPPVQPTTQDNEKLNLLLERQKQFKVLALQMKQRGDIDGAKKNLAIAKQFDSVIAAVKEGKEVDLSRMPQVPSVSEPSPAAPPQQPQAASSPPKQPVAPPSSSSTPGAPSTVLEALEQRLEKYRETGAKAKEEGNSGKVRRMGRIVKQFEAAIKDYKANKPVDFNELPCPPGFGPIPGETQAEEPGDPQEMAQMLINAPLDGPEEDDTPKPPSSKSVAPAPSRPAVVNPGVSGSRNENQYQFLVTRQKEFKKAALEAKHAGNIDQARDYLRKAKGLDPMIEAASSGLGVDLTTVPSVRPTKGASTQQGSSPTGLREEIKMTGTNNENYVFVETALQRQIEAAEKNTAHYKLMGNLDAAKNFEMLLKNSQKDIMTLQQYKANKSPVPKCFYVKKTFPVTKSNPHLSDSELEITVVRCLNVPLQQGYQPKDMYTYVTCEMAYPTEKPQTATTTTIKETINPEYNGVFKVLIDRKQSAFKRFCRRGVVNFKLFYVRGFLKSDKAIGQASVKLTGFANKCEIHECVDIVDLEKGRKAIGGKIEIVLKIREPFVDKDTEIVNEKWLILDAHLRKLDMKTPSAIPQGKAVSAYESLEVMKSEKSLFERQVAAYKQQGKQPPTELLHKIKSHNESMIAIQNRLKQGGKPAVIEYLKNLGRGVEVEMKNAQVAAKKNDDKTAKNCLVKKKLLDKEIGVLKQRLGL